MFRKTRKTARAFQTIECLQNTVDAMHQEILQLDYCWSEDRKALNSERKWIDSLLFELTDRDEDIFRLRAELSASESKLENVKSTVNELYTELTYGADDDDDMALTRGPDHWGRDHDVWACPTCDATALSNVPF